MEPIVLELYAAGLGLMFYSKAAGLSLVEGRDYMPAGKALEEPLRSLVDLQEVAFLQTGSPQLDYELHIHRGPVPAEVVHAAHATVRFGLHVKGGALCIRDGYDPMEWHAQGESVREVPLPDGSWDLEAHWLPTHGGVKGMLIHLGIARVHTPHAGDVWPQLIFHAGGHD